MATSLIARAVKSRARPLVGEKDVGRTDGVVPESGTGTLSERSGEVAPSRVPGDASSRSASIRGGRVRRRIRSVAEVNGAIPGTTYVSRSPGVE